MMGVVFRDSQHLTDRFVRARIGEKKERLRARSLAKGVLNVTAYVLSAPWWSYLMVD